jgi:NADPH2:quinone reductase
MRAIVFDTEGPDYGVLRAVDLPEPEPGPGEVRVRTIVAGVNPTDWKARERRRRTYAWPQQVPGQDGAGVIDRVGPGVEPSRIGERVWLYLAGHGHPLGTSAEWVCVPGSRAVTLPDAAPFDLGAGLGVPALTAHRCLLTDGPVEGRTVLVTGGAGAVGHMTVQLAQHAGARVITTVSSAEKAAIAATAGPHVVLDYREPGFEELLREAAPEGIDRVVDVDVAGNIASYRDLLNEAAVIGIYASSTATPELATPVQQLMVRNILLRFVLLYGVPEAALAKGVGHVVELVAAGRLVPLPVIRFPLEELDAAHTLVRAGAMGKVLVDISVD